MKIGIIVYSQTGNTQTVGQKLQEALTAASREVKLERVTVAGEAKPESKDFRLETLPAVEGYDVLFFGAPVHAFSLAKAMTMYLDQLSGLQGKKVVLFVTKQLRFTWTGGSRAIGQMKKACESKGAQVLGSEIIVWSQAKKDLDHIEAVGRLSKLV